MSERFSIIITGAGAHHTGADSDADKIAAKLLGELRANGHEAEAKFVARGAEEALAPPAAAEPKRLKVAKE